MAINPFEQSLIAMPKPQAPKPQSIWENQEFLQYLAAAGAGLQSGEGIAAPLGAAVTGNIATKNYRSMMAQLLAGKVPGGKITTDEKGVTTVMPADSILGMGERPEEGHDIGMSMPPGVNPETFRTAPTTKSALATRPAFADVLAGGTGAVPITSPEGGRPEPRPFADILAGLSGSDLAGLTPELMKGAIEQAMGDPLGDAYKRALTAESVARTEAMGASPALPKEPTSIQEYRFAQKQGFDGSYEEWKNRPPGSWEEYQLARLDEIEPYTDSYSSFLKDVKRPFYTPEQIKEQKEETQRGAEYTKGELFFDSGKATKALSDHMSSDAVDDRLTGLAIKGKYGPGSSQWAEATFNEEVDWHTKNISSRGGIIVSPEELGRPNPEVNEDGTKLIWTVLWKTGRTTEVIYEIP